MEKEIITLQTMTKIGVPNVNNVVYNKEAFEEMINKASTKDIKLTEGFKENNEIDMMTIRPERVLADVKEIRDGNIDISINKEKKKILDEALSKGFKPGMRYTAKLKKGEDGITEASEINLIAYDLVKDPYSDNKE